MRFGTSDLQLIGKILERANPEVLRMWGFTPEERLRADWTFEDIDTYLTERLDDDWAEYPVE